MDNNPEDRVTPDAVPLDDAQLPWRVWLSRNGFFLLMLAAFIQFFSYLSFTTLASIGRNRAYLLGGAVGLGVNLALNAVLIPLASFDGAAWATVATEVVVVAFLLTALARATELVSIPYAAMARTLVACAVMGLVYLAVDRVLPWPIAGATAGAAFVFAIHLLRLEGPGGLRALWKAARFEVADDDEPQTDTPSSR